METTEPTARHPIDSNGAIYIILAPEKSSYNATFPLARRLQSLGYKVIYMIPAHDQDYISDQGLEYRTFGFLPQRPVEPTYRGPFHKQICRWLQRRSLIRHGDEIANDVRRQAEHYIHQDDPILILMNPLLLWSSVPALRAKCPIITLNTTLASTIDSRYPPVFLELIPRNGAPSWHTRIRYAWEWLRLLTPIWFERTVREKWTRLAHGLLPERSLTSTTRRLGGRIRWGEYGPCLDVPEFVLSPSEIDFPAHRRSRNRTYIGACVDIQRTDGHWDWAGLDAEGPLVYCSLGTYSKSYPYSRRLFQSVCDALGKQADLQGVIQVGDAIAIEELGEMPQNIRVVRYAPQMQILRHTNIFITHGGFSSVREAAYFGVPMIVFPCWLDQPGNAARVIYHGMGVSSDISTVTPLTILGLLHELKNEKYKKAAETMKAAFRQQEDCQKGIDFIEQYLAEHAAAPQHTSDR